LHNVMRTRPIQVSSDPGSSESEQKAAVPQKHKSVLLQEAIEFLDIRESDTVVDATLGGAGHAREIIARLGAAGKFIGFDLDHAAIERAQNALVDAKCTVELVEENFREMGNVLSESSAERSVREIDKALFDLGWSSFQLEAGRGFSFNTNEPLVMTYSSHPSGLTAAQIVNTWGESSLADIIFGWGEERYARRIARAIIERREKQNFAIASDLADTIKSAVPHVYRHGRIHPATKTFQALRIAVNDELGALKDGLEGAFAHLKVGGRIAVITFHSIEDRQVKRYFVELEKQGLAKRVTKKPLGPSDAEIVANPRSRSAKLRVIEKVSVNSYVRQDHSA
jgi:16S rRNA (cytosine1402-N4)-methyltransferase